MQDALLSYSGYNTTNPPSAYRGWGTLFRSGCVVDGVLNCTAACQDVNQIFTDPHTFQNCMVVASLTVLGSTVTLDTSSADLAKDFSLHIDQPDFQSWASGVNQTIQDCLIQYLDNSSGVHDRWEPWYLQLGDLRFMNAPSFPSICNNLTAVPLNADIGGIGVPKATVFRGQCLPMAGLHLLLASSRHLPLSFPGAENLR